MDNYRVLFADGSQAKVHADTRDQAENKAVKKRLDSGAEEGSARVQVVNVIKG